MVDVNTIDSAESIKQLRTTARRSFNVFAKASIKAMGKKIYDRGEFLKAVFSAVRVGESAYQKSKAQFVRMVSEICTSIAQQIQQNPAEKQQDLKKISELKKLLLVLDDEQAIERRKADMMTRWIRGTYSEVMKIENKITGRVVNYNQSQQKMMQQNAANDNQEFKKAA